ncbi:MAG: S8 family peptidase [Candidatus Cyclobacteriaceae bacterium M3_2C_046]
MKNKLRPQLAGVLLVLALLLTQIYNIYAHSDKNNSSGTSIDSLNQSQLNWYNMDPEMNEIQGASVDRAYQEILKNRKPQKKIIVAVIDGGVDVQHEDLQGKIWINKDEVPDNGLDDDKNGYVDDIHGWNFLGNRKGQNISYENLEFVRILRKLKPQFENVAHISEVSAAQKDQYKTYLKVKKRYEQEVKKYQEEQENLAMFEERLKIAEEILKSATDIGEVNLQNLLSVESDNKEVLSAKRYLLYLYQNEFTWDLLEDMKAHTNDYLEKHLNLELEAREIINDDHTSIKQKYYGNNDVKGPEADHGTFVAGIIGAVRDNELGIDGIAENIEIMVLRTVPQGDEYDKDVALSIRYAVDNGANIINMSFGKDFSPEKHMVDEAIKYAEANNVLLVHAAGNDAENIDDVNSYPTDLLNDNSIVETWINVGAIDKRIDENFVGGFSNYGRQNVDLFAPGVDIISLYPENKYDLGSGTSFSSPVVSGVAALIWSYYPDLTAVELKEILLKSTTNYKRLKVYSPGEGGIEGKKTRFKKLCKTGGIVNAYEGLLLADRMNR